MSSAAMIIHMHTYMHMHAHAYHRGATIEKCVELLTSDPSKLWGGFSLVMGPHPHVTPTNSASNGHSTPRGSKGDLSDPSLHASKDQVIQFFLTMYKSFVHPLILARLLLHRLSSDDQLNLFDWSNDISALSPTAHMVSIPPIQLSVLNLIGRWLELYSEDFCSFSSLRGEIDRVVSRLKLVRGSYIPHTHRLRYVHACVQHAACCCRRAW